MIHIMHRAVFIRSMRLHQNNFQIKSNNKRREEILDQLNTLFRAKSYIAQPM